MRTSFIGLILALFLSSLMLSSCSDEPDTNTRAEANRTPATNANTAKSNVEELSMLVRVPYETEDIAWRQDPASRSILAVFRFSPEDAKKVVAEAEAAGPGRPVSVPVENWYPDELVAQGEMSGDSTLKGTAYSATGFFQEPYNSGRLTRVEGVDYFILEISPK